MRSKRGESRAEMERMGCKKGENVPNRERSNSGTKAQYVVVGGREDYQRMEKSGGAGRADRRKTGVNRGDFG